MATAARSICGKCLPSAWCEKVGPLLGPMLIKAGALLDAIRGAARCARDETVSAEDFIHLSTGSGHVQPYNFQRFASRPTVGRQITSGCRSEQPGCKSGIERPEPWLQSRVGKIFRPKTWLTCNFWKKRRAGRHSTSPASPRRSRQVRSCVRGRIAGAWLRPTGPAF